MSVRRVGLIAAVAVCGTLGMVGMASARDYVPGHDRDPAYGHHRDSSGADHYGPLYSKPMGSPAGGSGDTAEPSSNDNLSPDTLMRTFVP